MYNRYTVVVRREDPNMEGGRRREKHHGRLEDAHSDVDSDSNSVSTESRFADTRQDTDNKDTGQGYPYVQIS